MEQGSDKVPDFGEIESDQDAGHSGEQFGPGVDFHNSYLVFLRLPLGGAAVFFAAGFAGALGAGFLGAGFPLAGALGGGAV